MDGILSTTKAILLSPIFGVAALAGIIGYELWKGKQDAANIKKDVAANLNPAKS